MDLSNATAWFVTTAAMRRLALLEQSMDEACIGQGVLRDFNFHASVGH